jgi:indole-3-glycerol phosphate synthase
MSDILTEIIRVKESEVEAFKAGGFTVGENPLPKSSRSMYRALKKTDSISIIAEIKRASPSKGDILPGVNPVEQALQYEKFGASGISVLTDSTFFKGSIEDLKAVRAAVNLPILCKDFIIDEIQIQRAKEAGADVILLIAAALSSNRLKELYSYTIAQGLEAIIEVHDDNELERALELDAQLIGVNNRDLKTFNVDLSVTERLAGGLGKSSALLISESGISTAEDISRVRAAGASAVLVGETLMKSDNMQVKFKEFLSVD